MKTARLDSIDALRGLDMMFISGLTAFIIAVCNLFPQGSESWLATQMHHVPWDGFAHHDTIFPLFLFLAGVSFPFSFASSVNKGLGKKRILCKQARRMLILIVLGMVCSGLLAFNPEKVRLFSVLGRIGVAGFLASVIYMYFKPGTRVGIALGLLVGYFGINLFVAPDAPAGANSFSVEGNFACYVDRLLFPNLIYKRGIYDPEGLLSTLPAVVTAMLGNFTGELVRSEKWSGNRKTVLMLAGAALLLVVGLLWSRVYPINKALWSSTFVLVAGAYSLACFAVFYWIIDVKGYKKWAFPLKVVGMNSITIYLFQKVINVDYTVRFFLGGLSDLIGPEYGKVLIKLGYMLVVWLAMYFLYKKNVFLKV